MNVRIPDAVDIDPGSLKATTGLSDSARHLDSRQKLNQLYSEDGYLLFRDVLDRESVDRALRRMMVVMSRHGIVEEGAKEPIWTGRPLQGRHEESEEFAGICKELIEHPKNIEVFEKLLGEPVCQVPIVEYRSYPPNTPQSFVHQDGFVSPGIHNYRPLWLPLMTIDPSIGGLLLAPGQHTRGYLHNLGKPPLFPIPEGIIPTDAWATTTYHPGDVLVVHPQTPHVGLRNTSNKVRFSIDTRVQSAANPCVFVGDIVALRPNGFTMRCSDGQDRDFGVDEETFIRTGENPRVRIPLENLVSDTKLGLRVVAAAHDGQAKMIRRASEG